jgi:hypothetical protein
MIYVNGCSYTFGIGCAPHGDEPAACKRNSWPTKLSNLTGTQVLNEALPGSSNARIFRDTIDYLSDNNPDLVIIMWSDPGRIEGFMPKESDWFAEIFDLHQITPQAVQNIDSYFHREALESYYSFLHTDTKACLDTLSYMNAIQQICKAKNIPYISHCYKSNIERQTRHTLSILKDKEEPNIVKTRLKIKRLKASLDDFNFGVNNVISFNSLVVENYLPFSEWSLGHPGIEAHEFMAQWFKDFMDKHEITG